MELTRKLSAKYTLADVVKSQTATMANIAEQFTPPEAIVINATALCVHVLDKIPLPFSISSFYRCQRLNAKIGGSRTSDHMLGRSADLDTQANAQNAAIFNYIKQHLEFDQLIWEYGNDDNPDWVHVSYRTNGNRNQILRASKVNGKTVYSAFKA